MSKVTLLDIIKDTILMLIIFFMQLWFNNCVYETDFFSVIFGMTILLTWLVLNSAMNSLLDEIKYKIILKKRLKELDKMLEDWEDSYKNESK